MDLKYTYYQYYKVWTENGDDTVLTGWSAMLKEELDQTM